MTDYYFNEAALVLPGVRRMVDRTVQEVDVIVEDGTELHFVVTRRPLEAGGASVPERLGALIAEKRRALRGFSVVSMSERSYSRLAGIEVRLRFRGAEGPVYQHQLHCAIESASGPTWMAFHCQSTQEASETCDAWMAAVLESLRFAGE